jgi:type I restriction enzyme S subunit
MPSERLLTHYAIPILDETGAPALQPAGEIQSHKFLLEHEAVLVSLLNPRIPRVWKADGSANAVCSTEFAVLMPRDGCGLDLRYLHVWTSSDLFWSEVQRLVAGTTGSRQRVKPDELMSLPMPLPPLHEQRRIVDLIDAVDEVRAATQAEAGAAADLASGFRMEHFIGAVGDVTSAGEFFQITMGRQRSPKHAQGDHMIPYMRAANVKDARLVLDDVKAMNFNPVEQAKYALEPGDVLVSEGCGSLSQLGASAQWNGEIVGTIGFQNTLLRLRARDGVSIAGYAMQWARYAFESGAFAAIASGTNIFHIGSERAVLMPLRATPLSEQEAFVGLVEAADRQAGEALHASYAGDRLRASLLADLLSGEHEIPASYDELLEAV